MAACLSDARVDHDRVPPEFRRAQPATWRSRLIKVAATVITTTRSVFVQLGGGWPFLELGRAIIKRAHTVPAKP